MSACSIEWGRMTISEWDGHFGKVRRSNLLQHYPYAQAIRAAQCLGARHGLISIDGQPAGIVQVGEIGILRNAIHVLSLDRGPLWFKGFGNTIQSSLFFAEFNRQFPRRFARRRRILPEVAFEEAVIEQLSATGLAHNNGAPRYETIWMDITPDLDVLRARLSGKWRNALTNAERQNFSISVDSRAQSSSEFLRHYERTKQDKNYGGTSVEMLRALIGFMTPRKEVLILNAQSEGRTVASILVLLHGSCATYQASWSGDEGRKMNCHNRLLWEAIGHLKARGIQSLDLGGVNRVSATGVTRFKEGMGGQALQLCGHFH